MCPDEPPARACRLAAPANDGRDRAESSRNTEAGWWDREHHKGDMSRQEALCDTHAGALLPADVGLSLVLAA